MIAGGSTATAQQSALHTLLSPDMQSYGRFGTSIAPAGDANRDGIPDIVIGAPSEGDERPGQAYVFSGADGTVLHRLTSDEPQKRGDFGFAVAGVQGEETAHVVVAAPRESAGRDAPRGGNAYLFEGDTGALRDAVDSPNEGPNGRMGFTVQAMPDFDGDGIRDLAVGAPSEGISNDPPTTGRAYILSGDDGDDLFEVEPPQPGTRLFGYAVAGAPDVNGGGAPDLIVGSVGGASQERYAGAVYVYTGENERLLMRLSSPNEAADGRFGSAVAAVSDVNGDGTADIVVGAPGESTTDGPEAGRAYILSGANGELLHTLVSPTAQSNGRFGESVAAGVDIDGDGVHDVLVGAPSEASSAGRVHIFSGADGSLIHTLQSPRNAINGGFGSAIAVIDDLDGDMAPDLLVGATGESHPNGTERTGAAYVFSSTPLVTGAARASNDQ